MIGDDVETARLERPEDRPVHGRPVDPEMSEVMIVEHQGHEIELRRGELRWYRILERPHDGGDRRGLHAVALQLGIALGEGDRRGTRASGRRCRRGRRRRYVGMTVALGVGRRRRRLAGSRPALAVDATGGPDRSGQQLGSVAAGGTEIEGGDARADADEDQHLLGLAPQIVGAIGGAAIRACDELLDLGRRQGRRRLLPHPRMSAKQ